MKYLILITIFMILQFGQAAPEGTTERKQLLLIFLDGFRYDYVDMQPSEDLPGFNKFLGDGVRANYSTTVFPSISYPSWTSIMTGLYPESHGVVGNNMYDAEEKDVFLSGDNSTTGKEKWWTSEQIWITATKAGRRTASIYMSRCDVPFDGVTPEYCDPVDDELSRNDMTPTAQRAIQKLDEGYDFVLMYNYYIDSTGHNYGPESEEMKQVLREIDSTMVYMQEELEIKELEDNVNIVIVSDHGMVATPVSNENIREIDDYLDPNMIEKIVEYAAFSTIKVLPEYIDEVYDNLRHIPDVQVYKKEDIPENFHLKNGKHIHDIVLIADIDTYVMASRSDEKMVPTRSSKTYIGNHGWDPREEKMRTIFFAKGPDFKKGEVIDPINNIDIYELLAHLLEVEALPNNGTFETISAALLPKDEINFSKEDDLIENRRESGQKSIIPSCLFIFTIILVLNLW